MRTLYLDALNGKTVERTPLWIMRQAGRYLPEYRKVRSQFSDFMDMCRNADACCEVALQPLDRYDLDASIVFSDILTIPEAMGMDLKFVKGEGPVFAKPLTSLADVNALITEDAIEKLQYVMNAVSTTKRAVKDRVPLIGFTGSPWTLAAYMVEGKGSKQFSLLRKMMYSQPQTMHALLDKVSDVIIDYLKAQVVAGADALMIFDTWGGVLSHDCYPVFSLSYMKKIMDAVKQQYPSVPITLFTKGGGQWLEMIVATGCDGVGLDWTTKLSDAKKITGNQCTIQGNLDPAQLYGDYASIRASVKKTFELYGSGSRHVFNLGHGVYPDIDPEHVKCLVEAVKEYGIKPL